MHDTSLRSLPIRLCVHHTWRNVVFCNVHVKQVLEFEQKIFHVTLTKMAVSITFVEISI